MPEQTKSILGIDVGGTKTALVEGVPDGSILSRVEYPTNATESGVDKLKMLCAELKQIRRGAIEAGREPVAISVSIGGPLKIDQGVLYDPPHLPGWHNLDLPREIGRHIADLPVFVEHDGNAGALAEFYFGVGKQFPGLRHLVFLTFGTGLGAGLIVNGALLRGASDTAGEVGHWRLADSGPYGFGKHGSWEGFASGRGLVHLAAERFPGRWKPDTEIRSLVGEMLAGDPEALHVARESGEWMGRGIALLVDALNPEVVALGSLGRVLGDLIIQPARQVVDAEALPQAAAAVKIVPAVLGSEIGDVASIMAALVGLKLIT